MPSITEKTNIKMRPTMLMAATAGSPHMAACTFKRAVARLARAWREKLGRPQARIRPISAARRVNSRGESTSWLLRRKNMESRMQKLTHWESAVASAAPEIPR